MMHRLLSLLPVLLTGLFWAAGGPLHAQDEGIHWLGNYQEALQEAKRTRKPIFLEFRCEA